MNEFICRICGKAGEGQSFEAWVKPTFMDWDKLVPGEIICSDCLFWFEERSEELARRVGKEKPQRMRNYSHFIVAGEWIPLSKGDKTRMQALLFASPFPELAAVAVSGQKHIAFRAQRNPPGAAGGWVQVEEQALYLAPDKLRAVLATVEALYAGFSKSEIETGDYAGYRVLKFGLEAWQSLEAVVSPQRGSLLFQLALFLAQKGTSGDGRTQAAGHRTAGDSMARDAGGLQKPVSDEHLGSVSRPDQERGLHKQPGQVYQLTLPEIEL